MKEQAGIESVKTADHREGREHSSRLTCLSF